MRIAIVGGGIVGLTTALSLAAAGFRPTVYEAISDIKPLGVGINLLPHAVRELKELGLLDDLKTLGVEIQKLTYRMQDGREVWSEPREDWNRVVDRARLVPPYLGWKWESADVEAIVRAGSDVYEFPMVDRDPLPRLSFGRVTLACDAAHPMYPIGSNGATQGIIDARALAYHLAIRPDPVTALKNYEGARRPATSRIVMSNRALGPDKVLEIAREHAGDPNSDADNVFPIDERREIADAYKKLAGFSPALLSDRQSYSVSARRSHSA